MGKRKLKKQAREILRSMEEGERILSTNKGRFIHTDHCPNKVNPKKRRHSGWITPKWGYKGKYSEEIAVGNEPQIFWDDWLDRRDGMRFDPDPTHLRGCPSCWCGGDHLEIDQANERLKKLIERRRARLKKRKQEEVFLR
jgi:hypothetical protein